MALNIYNVADPRDPSTPLATAYAWLSGLSLDLRGEGGKITFDVHPSESAWQGQPVDRVAVSLGQRFGDAAFPTLAGLLADPEFAAAYGVIATKLYQHAGAVVPAFAGADPA